jgi:hypothetical protein
MVPLQVAEEDHVFSCRYAVNGSVQGTEENQFLAVVPL